MISTTDRGPLRGFSAPSWPTRIELSLVGLALAIVGLTATVRFNLFSPSAPTGIWVRSPGQAEVGDWVLACLPGPIAEFGRLRGYHPAGVPGWRCTDGSQPVLKRVEAAGGDRVSISPEAARIEARFDREVPRLARDRRGRVLPAPPYAEYRLTPEQVWLGSTRIPNSWDSRYYGPVPRGCVRARMTRLLPL